MPKVTVVIPSYNHAKFIGEAIQSVLDQTFQDFEVLIRDDGSKDNSIEVIKQFTDSRIKFAANPHNMGACYTVNTMIEEASGEYIALLNSDDVWMLDKLEKQVKFLNENPQYSVVFSDAQVIYEDGRKFDNPQHFSNSVFKQPNRSRADWLKYFFEVRNCICHPSMLIKKSVYSEVGLYNCLMASLPDFEMWIRVCARHEIYIMPEKTINFRILDNEQNASGYNPANLIRGTFENAKLFDAFCLIDNVEIFNQIFFDAKVSDIRQIPFVIAKLLLDDQRVFAVYWAINKIYQLLNDNYNYYSQFMTDVEFTKLAASKDIYDIFNTRGALVQLYYDNGRDFNAEQYLQQKVVIGKNSYSFNLEDLSIITQLRLDPINQPAKVKLLSAYAELNNEESYPLELVWHNADLNADAYDFKHDDPQMIFNIPDSIQAKLVSVEFEVEITPYNKWEVLQLLANFRNESYTMSQQLVITQKQLQQAEQQVQQLNPWSHSVFALYYDIGQDFNEKHYLQQSAQSGLSYYEFSLREISGIKGMRLDPLNLPAHVKLISAQLVAKSGVSYLLTVAWHNANNLVDNCYSFYHDDPILIFDWSQFCEFDYDKIVFEFKLELIEVHELSNFVVQQLAVLNTRNTELSATQSELSVTQSELSATQSELSVTQSELSATQSELSATQSELSATQSELSVTQSELRGVYNSRSWKITKPLRKFMNR